MASALAIAFTGVAAPAKAKRIPELANRKRDRHPEVYLLRGLANIFSLGLDEIGRRLQMAGINANVEAFTASGWALDRIVADRQKYGPQPIILVGHSLGANAIIDLAESLGKRGVQVDYLATFAATSPDPLPGNVKHAVNFYFASHGWGVALVPGPNFRGRLENRDCSQDAHVDHFNIEKQRPLQDEVVSDILRVVR